MRVLVAPDKFAGTLTAVEAATAIEEGWRRRRPDDEVLRAPLSDGGPGFVDAMHAALGGRLHALTVHGLLGRPTPATLLLAGTDALPTGSTASPTASPTAGLSAGLSAGPSAGIVGYVESAQACGLALLPRDRSGRRPEPDVAERATTLGVGELVVAAVQAGAGEVVVGLGGSGTNDAGAGLLAALGARAEPPDSLTAGAVGLSRLTSVDLAPATARLAGVRLVAASDVDNPLLGLRGATNVYGPQKGLSKDRLYAVDGALTHFAHLVDRQTADTPGAGAAGGLGYALALLGATRRRGFDLVAQASGLDARLAAADLVLTGEGSLDPQTFTGKVVAGVAAMARDAGVPCVAVAGRVDVGSRELRAAGLDGAYGMADAVGLQRALARPAQALADVAERAARTWGR